MSSQRPPPSGPSKGRKRPMKPGKPGKPPKGTRSPTNNAPAFQTPAEWQTWPEMTIQIDKLPKSVTTSNLWDWFSHEGEIVYIDIYELPRDPALSSAKIRFEPPPKRAFWSTGTYWVSHPDVSRYPNGLKIFVSPFRGAPRCWIRSPVSPDRFYPIKITLHPLAIQFGSILGPRSVKVMKSFYNTVDEHTLKLEINLRSMRLTAFFPMEVETRGGKHVRQHKVAVDFSKMKHVHQSPADENGCALVMPISVPPQYYWKRSNIRSSFSDEAYNWNTSETWNRATDLVEQAGIPMKHPVALHNDYKDPGFIDIGRWTTIRFVLVGSTPEAKLANQQVVNALDDFNITTQVHEDGDFRVTHGAHADMWKHLEQPTLVENGNALEMLQQTSDPIIHLPFEIRYQLEVCISRDILNEHTITLEFLEKLASMNPRKARLYLEYLADQGEPVQNPMSIFQNPDAEAFSPITRIPQYCALVRKVVVTPTTIRFNSPAVEMSNRVMRQYKHIQDRFLRIQFVEELENNRIAINKDQNDEIYKRVLRTMYQGIRIGDRIYEFLAFGSSQLRVNGAYFFCPTEHTSCDDIRKWMGQFSHIKVVAKYAARLGQCFSTTREVRGISSPAIRELPDIERNGHCFSDGVGKISPFVAQLVNEDMALDIFDKPSAFQFRMGGCKGVLTVWPDAKGMEVHVRESQKKFEADSKGLEIIRCAGFATATLNRQTIIILESLGVPIKAFTDLLDQQLGSYEQAMQDNGAAIEMLAKFVDEHQTNLVIAELLKAEFKTDELREPFVINVLNLWRAWSLKILKEKARIQVEKSAFVLGCVDETETLRGHSKDSEGSKPKDINMLPQIFLQITDSRNYNKTHIIQGVCIVGRNPSLHPGDIRVVEAVDCPKLRHIRDVVVFPATGDRPVPNMLSGGDLDGDDFFVIWEPSLIPKTWNYSPMDYAAPKPKELDRDVNVDDLRNFFVKYLKNDKLPLIATSHLGFADQLGPMSPKCLELAELHSKAVDYPKTGEPATLRRDQQPRRWPHFMEKKQQYHSDKALGVIYDKVVNKAKVIQFNPIWDSPFDDRITKKYKLNNELLKAARKVKSQYDTAVRRLLSQHDLKTEFELWTGFAMSKPAVGTDYKLQESLSHEYDALKYRFRDICYEAAGGKLTDQVDRFVAAMYTVTEEETKIALFEHHRGPINDAGHILQPRKLEPKSMPLISFPWIFHWVMCRLALGAKYDPKASVLAAAHRKATQHHRSSPDPGPSQVSACSEQEQEAMPEPGLGPEVHRGQPLALFEPDDESCHDDDDAPSETLLSMADEGKASTGQDKSELTDSSSNNHNHDGGGGGGDVSQEVSDEAPEEGDSCGGQGQVTEQDVEEESAMDRLGRLTGE
ncbi:RNA-dependent RNA polymerase [Fusarium sp. LHS14.1]|nr:RNA-dependent RNA polymerase [Fusarium sp. LHS14.1]